MSDGTQALCFFAGANSIFVGDTLLKAGNPEHEADRKLFMLIGTLSGGSARIASVTSMSTRSGFLLAHAEDPPATHFHAGLPNIFQRGEAIGKCAR